MSHAQTRPLSLSEPLPPVPQGRMKFTRPLFRELAKSRIPRARETAARTLQASTPRAPARPPQASSCN